MNPSVRSGDGSHLHGYWLHRRRQRPSSSCGASHLPLHCTVSVDLPWIELGWLVGSLVVGDQHCHASVRRIDLVTGGASVSDWLEIHNELGVNDTATGLPQRRIIDDSGLSSGAGVSRLKYSSDRHFMLFGFSRSQATLLVVVKID